MLSSLVSKFYCHSFNDVETYEEHNVTLPAPLYVSSRIDMRRRHKMLITFVYCWQVLEEAESSLEIAQEKCKEILNILEERNS